MHFDDRLATVLRQPVKGQVVARVQYRQLIDLLGRQPDHSGGPAIQAGYERLDLLQGHIPADVRARILSEPGVRLGSARMLAHLGAQEPAVASAAISAARLEEEAWLALIPDLPVRARGILRHRRGMSPRVDAMLEGLGITDRGLPPSYASAGTGAAEANEPVSQAPTRPAPVTARSPAEAESETKTGIRDIVKRIEEFRKSRETPRLTVVGGSEAPRLPLDDRFVETAAPRLSSVDFLTDPEGTIIWSDPATAMLVGRKLTAPGPDGPSPETRRLAHALRRRQPMNGVLATLSGAAAIAGEWQVDAAPRFDPLTGSFTGYSGRLRRPAPASQAAAQSAEGDRMRQILHELRTPANGIQMSAEVIQQQLFGPTPHEYRALAASIASDTALILAGFEELDRMVKLEGGALELEPGECDLAEIVARTVSQLQAHTDPRKSGFSLTPDAGLSLPIGLEQLEAERVIWRLLASIAGATAPSEVLSLDCHGAGGMAVVQLALPASLASRGEDELFSTRSDSTPPSLSAGMFGIGFTLRLAEAEARAAGGWLKRIAQDRLELAIPSLTTEPAAHSQG